MRFANATGRLASVALILGGLVIPASAAEVAQAAPPDPRHINCTCRAYGRSFRVGEQVCLSTAKGYRTAECRMQQNVTNWAVSPDECSVSASRLLRSGGTG
jgi:hypothetical protein